MGSLSSLLGKNIKFGRGEVNILGVGKEELTLKIGKQYPHSFNAKALGKNIKWRREEGALEI